MKDQSRTKQELIAENSILKHRIQELERAESERKRAEDALRESEEKYRVLLEESSDPIFSFTPEGQYKYVNRAFAEGVGKPVGKIIGKSLWDVFPKDEADNRFASLSQVFRTGEDKVIEVRVPRTDGDRYYLTTIIPIKDTNGEVLSAICSSKDITDRRQAEESLRESEERFRELAELLPETVFEIDIQGTLTFVNRNAFDRFGYTQEDFASGLNALDMIIPDDRGRALENIQRIMNGENVGSNEFTVQRKDGSTFPSMIHSTAIIHDGKSVGLRGFIVDITERKRVESTLRLITDNMSDLIRVTDLQGVNLYTSPSLFNVLGYKPEERIGKSAFDIVHPDDLEHVINVFSEGLISKKPSKLEYRIKHAEGHYVWLETIGDFIRYDQGEVTAVIHSSRDISKRKAVEEKLSKSEEKYRSIFENAVEGIFQTTMEGRFLSANPALANIFGYQSPEDLILSITNIGSQLYVSHEAREEHLRLITEKGVLNGFEAQMYRKDGSTCWISINTRLVRNDGDPMYYEGFIEDITERKRVEETLKAAEETYRNIFMNAQTGLFRTDINTGLILDANDCVARFIGYKDRGELLSKPFNIAERYADPKDRERMIFLLKEHGQFNDFETRFRRNDGSIIWMRFSAKIIPDKGWLEGVSEDITKEKAAEEALRESEEKYRNLFENANEAIFVAQDGKLVFLNPMTTISTGYSSEDLMAKPFIEFIHPDDRGMVIDRHIRRMKGEVLPHRYPFRIIHKDGNIRWIELNAVLIKWKGKTATLNFLSDLTERKQVEEDKRRLEERLQHADKMESIGTLAGGIAHDFNNLLMGIQGYASLTLLDLDPSHPHYERLKRIEEQVQSGADLTRQLLGFARGGRYEVKPADMNDIVQKTSSMFGRTKKEISIHRKYGKDLLTVEVDQGQMEQVFMNLYVNAWQAMPGGGEIYLETENVLLDDEQAVLYAVKPGKYVKITVTDTGTGMDEKTRERIFDPFFTTKEMGRGTGLGLATVYGIIKGHKGMINVYSEPGHGTTFTIYLPASEKEVVKEKTATGAIARGTETILLVDDEKMVLEVSKAMLESMGYRVYGAGSGREAIAVYLEKQKEIDLVILDMIMPGISGGETFDRLREIHPDVKVLLSSGYSINGKAQTIMDRGCNGFLQKPFQLEKLSRKVREILD